MEIHSLPQFEIREARLCDMDPIADLFERNPSKHLMMRPLDVFARTRKNGMLFVVTVDKPQDDARAFSEAKIIGVSGCFWIEIDGFRVLEAGGSLIDKPFRGFGLHKGLHSLRASTAFIKHAECFDHYFGALIGDNPASEANLVHAGFKRWHSAPKPLIVRRFNEVGWSNKIRFFELRTDAATVLARELLRMHDVRLISRKGRPVAQVRFDASVLNQNCIDDLVDFAENRSAA